MKNLSLCQPPFLSSKGLFSKPAAVTLAIALALSLVLFFMFVLFPDTSYAQGHDHSSHTGHAAPAAPSGSADKGLSKIFVARGTITEISPDKSSLTINHGPIEALGWGSMVMPFKVEDSSLLEELKAGDKVRFDLTVKDPGNNTDYFISDIETE
jgi:Cu/Ag efflux protein CusF